MRSVVLLSLAAAVCLAQTTSSAPALIGAGFSNPFPISAAPGQLLTLFVQPGAGYDPLARLPNVAALFVGVTNEPMPVLQLTPVSNSCPLCPALLAVTVQVPLEVPLSPANPSVLVQPSSIIVSVNGVSTSYIGAQAVANKVHIITACDILAPPVFPASSLQAPCAPLVTHSDGTVVAVDNPATGGEELVAYATGLGQTNPALITGQPAAGSNPTFTAYTLDFNYQLNALATKPLPTGAAPLFAGSTKGFVGLYQINFTVPAAPAGLQPCAYSGVSPNVVSGVFSNLTVSVGSIFSFDGAGICVQPEPVLDPPAADE